MRSVFAVMVLGCLAACQSAYFGASENFGFYAQDVLADRVEASKEAQRQAKDSFQAAADYLPAIIHYAGGDLKEIYLETYRHYSLAKSDAKLVRERVQDVENVAEDLFQEWVDKIKGYSDLSLQASNQRRLYKTRRLFASTMEAMQRSTRRIDPVMESYKENVINLRNNLNVQGVTNVRFEFEAIERDMHDLIDDMQRSITSSEEFVKNMREG